MLSPLRLASFLSFAVLFGCTFARAAEPVLPEAFRARILEGVESGALQSVAVGLVGDGVAKSEFFGHLDGRDGVPLDEHSRVEIGAMTEPYVGLLLADLVISGKVRLSDTLSELLPKELVFSDGAIGELSLGQLAMFHSGLPSVPPNLFPRSELDPFEDYDASALRALAANVKSQGGLGGGVLDLSLLGYALEQRTGGDVAGLLRSRVIAELGLEHTGFGDGDLAVGHYLGGRVPPWHFSGLAPARGLRSDLGDQLKFAQAFLRPSEGPLQSALLLARQARGDAALGWHVLTVSSEGQDWPVLWNGGNSAGHASFVGLRADQQQAVVLLGNTSTDLSSLGLALLTEGAPPALPARTHRLESDKANDYGGLYRFDAKDEVVVRPAGDGLTLQRKGQFPLQLVAYDDDAFAVVGMNAQITFQRNGAKHVDSLLLHQGGLNLSATRLSQRAPQVAREAAAFDAAQISACVGDFALGENLQFRLARQGSGLTWQLSGMSPRSLIAFAPQRFASSDGALEIRCSADDEGQVGMLKLILAGGEIEVPRLRWSELGAARNPKSDDSAKKK